MGLSKPHSHGKPASRPGAEELCPRHALHESGLGEQTAYELISNELLLDGSARLNLATFVTTWMPSLAGQLMAETADKNMIDKDEYPQTAEIEARCVKIIADLWHAPQRATRQAARRPARARR
jgi:glutamate decarboxylase